MFLDELEGDEEKYSSFFRKSRNMTELSSKKRERHAKSHENFVDEPESGKEIRLNPIMKDFIINGYVDGYNTQYGKRKRRKQ
jgi:hypothetical protein